MAATEQINPSISLSTNMSIHHSPVISRLGGTHFRQLQKNKHPLDADESQLGSLVKSKTSIILQLHNPTVDSSLPVSSASSVSKVYGGHIKKGRKRHDEDLCIDTVCVVVNVGTSKSNTLEYSPFPSTLAKCQVSNPN